MTSIKDFDRSAGLAFQGDIAFIPLPDGYTPKTNDEVPPIDGRLIIQEGEASGHHHAIKLPQPTMFRDDALARGMAVAESLPTVRMFRDNSLAQRLVRDGYLTRADLCIGFLVVENGPVVVAHEEHDGIRFHPGVYYCGRQIESAGAEERVVID
jgi:hypothetical protein